MSIRQGRAELTASLSLLQRNLTGIASQLGKKAAAKVQAGLSLYLSKQALIHTSDFSSKPTHNATRGHRTYDVYSRRLYSNGSVRELLPGQMQTAEAVYTGNLEDISP